MRFMEAIRRRGHWFLIGFLIVFTISLFFGLTGGFTVNPFQSNRAAEGTGSGKVPSVISDKELKGTAIVVNGRKVSNDVLEQVAALFVANYNMRDENDPTVRLNSYGYAANMVINQELLLAYGEDKGIKMSSADWQKAKSEAAANFIDTASEDKKAGNILGDTLGKLSDVKAQNAAFSKYLEVNGYRNEESWERDAQRDLYARKVREAIDEEINSAKKAETEKVKAEVDKELAAKKDFAEVAKKYSDGSSKEQGGDLKLIGRELLDPAVSDKLFAVKEGEISEWIEIPAGWQKFQVYDKQEAKGAEFEKAKPGLIQSLRDQRKDPAYEPTDDELAKAYEKVGARVIELHTSDPEESAKRIEEMVKSARVEVNHPYVLAYQALRDFQIQAGGALTKEQLIKIAELTPLGEGYDWTVLDQKLAAGRPKAGTGDSGAAEEATPAEDAADDAESAGVEGKPDLSGAESMTDSAASGAEPGKAAAPVNEEEKVYTPIYALAAGLVAKAIQDSDGGTGDDWPYFLQAKIYYDWMKDEAEATKQPIKTKEARAQLEDLLAKVVKSSNYNATAHALHGLNYARLEQQKEASEELALAHKYAPADKPEVWQIIREGYEVLDDTAKLSEIDLKLKDIQQKQFQEMIQRQLSQQPIEIQGQ